MVVAVALRPLPEHLGLRSLAFGGCTTIVLSVFLTFSVAKLLAHSFVKLTGGAIVFYLVVALFVLTSGEVAVDERIVRTAQAVKILVIADVTMSLDNMPAVARAAQGNFFLLFIGLGASIPVVFFASTLLCGIIEKYPIFNYIGCAVLGKVGAEKVPTDPIVVCLLVPTRSANLSAQTAAALFVIICRHFWMKAALRTEKATVGDRKQV